MRLILLVAASGLALGASACAPRVDYAHRTALDCPDRQGELDRVSISPDRKTCVYRAADGVDVTLQLTPVSNGDANATLAAVEASLLGPAAAPSAGQLAADKTAGVPVPPAPPAPPAPPSGDAARVAQEAAQDARGSGAKDEDWDAGDHKAVVVIGKGGVTADEDHANIDLPGLHIKADGGNARVDVGGVHINANDTEATVHVVREVRLRGQAFSRHKNGLRATFIAKRDNLPDGYRFVGYQASGPKTGPLTIAVVKSRQELEDGNSLYHDIQRLVRRNGGA